MDGVPLVRQVRLVADNDNDDVVPALLPDIVDPPTDSLKARPAYPVPLACPFSQPSLLEMSYTMMVTAESRM